MKSYYQDDLVTLYHGDCVEVMRELPDASVHAVVTDPPYGLGFMGKAWDADFMRYTTEQRRKYAGDPSGGTGPNGGYRSAASEAGPYDLSLTGNQGFQLWCQEWALEALRVLKPGGHLLAFGGTRTWHRLAVAVEDAGFEVRDSIAWMYGSGFPKSLDVAKAVTAKETLGNSSRRSNRLAMTGEGPESEMTTQGKWEQGQTEGSYTSRTSKAPPRANLTPAAQQWQGWGTALKPAFEPIVVARKPLVGTVAENVLAHGTGALNIDGCRIASPDGVPLFAQKGNDSANGIYGDGLNGSKSLGERDYTTGRWPANVILDESQAAELDKQSGESVSATRVNNGRNHTRIESYTPDRGAGGDRGHTDSGGASRFFYVPKAGSNERPRDGEVAHPTVKPLELMRYLVKLVTPPGGTVLEPFAGSGTTLEACVVEGFQVIGIELTEDYLPLITQRITKPIEQVLL